MTEPTPPTPVLDEASATLIRGPVSVIVAGRGPDGLPTVTRAVGCRLSPDRRRLTVFVAADRAEGLLDGVRANGAVAVSVNRPSTHASVQVKGVDAVVEPLADDELGPLEAYRDAWAAELGEMGYAEAFARALVSGGREGLLAVRFTPAAAYHQSPGPEAGRPLRADPDREA
jgi:hypothetical protein